MPRLPYLIAWCIVSIFFLFIISNPVNAIVPFDSRDRLPQQYIIKYRNTISLEDRLALHRQINADSRSVISQINSDVVSLVDEALARRILNRDKRIAYFEPDYQAYALAMSNDPAIYNQWNLTKIQAAGSSASGWDYSKGNPEVAIAVLDTGIDSDHEDLKNKISASHNCTNSSTSGDRFGHGTHVAGIAAAATNNNLGIAGIGYAVKLINAKGLGDDGSGYYSWIASCIIWAADNGARVINMSLGGSYYSKTLEDAVNYAWNKGAVLVAAAGNSATNSYFYPAAFTNVMAVAATDKNDNRASFSNYGLWVSVAAPGVSIYSTMPGYANSLGSLFYGYLSGTSMASPHVAGLAALLFSLPSFNNISVVNNIKSYSDKILGTGFYYKYGRINAFKSLQNATNSQIITPTSTPVPSIIPSITASKTPTLTPTRTITPTKVPTPTTYNPWARWCSRYPFLCK